MSGQVCDFCHGGVARIVPTLAGVGRQSPVYAQTEVARSQRYGSSGRELALTWLLRWV